MNEQDYNCQICGEVLEKSTYGHARKQAHMRAKHPEYEFIYEYKTKDYPNSAAYKCAKCGQTLTGIAGIIEHYNFYHPESLKTEQQPEKKPPTEKEVKRLRTSTTCDICGVNLGHKSKVLHMEKFHPEFPLTYNERHQPKCGICGVVGRSTKSIST